MFSSVNGYVNMFTKMNDVFPLILVFRFQIRDERNVCRQ